MKCACRLSYAATFGLLMPPDSKPGAKAQSQVSRHNGGVTIEWGTRNIAVEEPCSLICWSDVMAAPKKSSPSWAAAKGLEDLPGEGAADPRCESSDPRCESIDPLILGSKDFSPLRRCCPLLMGIPGGSCLAHGHTLSTLELTLCLRCLYSGGQKLAMSDCLLPHEGP